MKKHLAHIAALAIAVGIGWFSHSALAAPQIAPCTIGPGIAVEGQAQISCTQIQSKPVLHDRTDASDKSVWFTPVTPVTPVAADVHGDQDVIRQDEMPANIPRYTGRITAQEVLLVSGTAKEREHCETNGLIARAADSGALLFCQDQRWTPVATARSNVASN